MLSNPATVHHTNFLFLSVRQEVTRGMLNKHTCWGALKRFTSHCIFSDSRLHIKDNKKHKFTLTLTFESSIC